MHIGLFCPMCLVVKFVGGCFLLITLVRNRLGLICIEIAFTKLKPFECWFILLKQRVVQSAT